MIAPNRSLLKVTSLWRKDGVCTAESKHAHEWRPMPCSVTHTHTSAVGPPLDHVSLLRAQAASSRGMAPDAMQEVAQGRVWSGRDALSVGLVDALGGVSRAVAVAKQAAGLSACFSGSLLILVWRFDRRRTQVLSLLADDDNYSWIPTQRSSLLCSACNNCMRN